MHNIFFFCLINVQAIIHLESIQSLPKRIGYLDALVEKFVVPSSEHPFAASVTDREEVSCIFLEVIIVLIIYLLFLRFYLFSRRIY